MIEWFPRIVMILVATILIVVIVNYYAGRDVESADTEMSAQMYKLYYGDMIMYSDSSTGRVYPGIIDNSKFNDASLKSFVTPDGKALQVASRLTLTVAGQEKIIHTNQQTVLRYLGVAQSKLKGPQGATMQNLTFPVSVRDGESLKQGILNIVVVRSNS